MDLGAALAHEDVAALGKLTVGALRAQTLGLAVAAVAGGAHTFLMSEKLKIQFHHGCFPPFTMENCTYFGYS